MVAIERVELDDNRPLLEGGRAARAHVGGAVVRVARHGLLGVLALISSACALPVQFAPRGEGVDQPPVHGQRSVLEVADVGVREVRVYGRKIVLTCKAREVVREDAVDVGVVDECEHA